VYSQLAYFCPVLDFSPEFVRNIENLISNFVNLHLNVGKNKIFDKIEEGGLGLFRVKDYEKAIKASFFRKTLNNPDTWASVINSCKDCTIEHAYVKDETLEKFFPASQDLLNVYNEFHHNLYNVAGNAGETPIFDCDEIRHQGRVVGRDILGENEHYVLLNSTIKDICGDGDGNIWPFIEFKEKFGLHITLGTYNIIKNATLPRRKKHCNSKKINLPGIDAYVKSKKKGSKPFRKIFESQKGRQTAVSVPTKTREKLFNFSHSPEIEAKLYSLWNQNFLDNEVRTFMFKLASNRIKLNTHISKFEQDCSDLCKGCSNLGLNNRETFPHFFFNCTVNTNLLTSFNRVKREHFESNPAAVMITNAENVSTKFEMIIGGILIYILHKFRNYRDNRTFSMNREWKKIINQATSSSGLFTLNVDRLIYREIDPF
jgi:hypothetical protein